MKISVAGPRQHLRQPRSCPLTYLPSVFRIIPFQKNLPGEALGYGLKLGANLYHNVFRCVFTQNLQRSMIPVRLFKLYRNCSTFMSSTFNSSTHFQSQVCIFLKILILCIHWLVSRFTLIAAHNSQNSEGNHVSRSFVCEFSKMTNSPKRWNILNLYL